MLKDVLQPVLKDKTRLGHKRCSCGEFGDLDDGPIYMLPTMFMDSLMTDRELLSAAAGGFVRALKLASMEHLTPDDCVNHFAIMSKAFFTSRIPTAFDRPRVNPRIELDTETIVTTSTKPTEAASLSEDTETEEEEVAEPTQETGEEQLPRRGGVLDRTD
jgi:hypothetical protein